MTEPSATPGRPVALAVLLMGLFGVGLMVWSQQEPAPVSNDIDAVPAASLVKPEPPRPPAPTLAEGPAPTHPLPVMEDAWVELQPGLRVADITVGTGEELKDGASVTMQWAMYDREGKLLDGSHASQRPFTYVAGAKHAILGWDIGSLGMRVGGVRAIEVPHAMGFRDVARRGVPPRTDLRLDITLLDTRPVRTVPEAPTQHPTDAYVTTESGLRYVDLVEASGPPITPGQVALVHYTMWLEDGTRIDSSLPRNKPVRLQTHQTVASLKGWIEGVSSMGVGGHRQLVLSPDLAYGDHGRGTVIPPNATLIIEVTVEGVED